MVPTVSGSFKSQDCDFFAAFFLSVKYFLEISIDKEHLIVYNVSVEVISTVNIVRSPLATDKCTARQILFAHRWRLTNVRLVNYQLYHF